ncbi:MAG: NAD+ synthase [Deltaproteobacteria bacterium]|nr:NAD+ synthase [Deltaproteobacteria bacterium]
MKLALAQINPTIGDFPGNAQKIMAFANRAKGLGCDLVVFPELAVCGYPPRDLLDRPDFVRGNLRCLEALVRDIHGIGVVCGYVDENPGPQGCPLYNSAVLFESGRLLHRVHKRLLPDYDVFDESRYFEPGTDFSCFEYKGDRLGVTICEDIWNDRALFSRRLYAVDPVEKLVENGATLLINISSSPFYAGKRELKAALFRRIVQRYRVPLVYVNQVGGNDSLLFDGVSVVFDATGHTGARCAEFEEDLVAWDTRGGGGPIRPVAETEEESVLKGLVVGTRDYLQKCGFKRAVVGLSGGIDSALTATIAVQALGADRVAGIFMPSRFTSRENYVDTQRLAQNLGIAYRELPISDVFEAFLKALSPVFTGVETEVTGQNIQARIRGVLLMAYSNHSGALVLATGNKSELAVGYCTLYGDMCGGLAVISDVPKAMVYRLAALINREGEVIPERILTKAPSAELRPDQTDQDDLPPYDTLDRILTAYIEDNKAPDEIVAAGFAPETVRDTISRIHRNEYKRYQAPPGLKVTTKSFGYGRRYPMAQRFLPGLGVAANGAQTGHP